MKNIRLKFYNSLVNRNIYISIFRYKGMSSAKAKVIVDTKEYTQQLMRTWYF